MVCFAQFDFQMCFAPQLRALSTMSTSKTGPKWCALRVLTWKCASRHTDVHFFDHVNFQKWSEMVCLGILTWKCVSRHTGVQFFISHLATWLRTRRFSEPTFRPSGATNHWKNRVNCDFSTFSRACNVLSSHSFSSLIFSSLALPTSAFPSVHIVGSLTSKLPSIMELLNFLSKWMRTRGTPIGNLHLYIFNLLAESIDILDLKPKSM